MRFLTAPDAEAAAAAAATAVQTHAALDAFAALNPPAPLQALINQMKSNLDTYVAAFVAEFGDILKLNELFDQHMRPLVEDLATKVAAAEAALRQDFASTKESVIGSIGATVTMQKIVGLVALVLGSGLAVLLGRGVIRPVAGMTAAMEKLAAGDTGVEIPSRDARDEIGAMAKAVEVFRQNALDRLRLESQQAEQEQRAAKEKRSASYRWQMVSNAASAGSLPKSLPLRRGWRAPPGRWPPRRSGRRHRPPRSPWPPPGHGRRSNSGRGPANSVPLSVHRCKSSARPKWHRKRFRMRSGQMTR